MTGNTSVRPCLIFDMDGTLINSEPLSARALVELLPQLNTTVDDVIARYRGWRFDTLRRDIESRLGYLLPEDFESRFRARVARLFDHELVPMPGVVEVLRESHYPRCIASSAPPAKIEHALRVSGLAGFFEHIFSAYVVGSWKPDPGLFLHAAREMQFAPHECLVIEDSPVGVAAAKAAGMTVFQYDPADRHEDSDADARFSEMAELPTMIAGAWQS